MRSPGEELYEKGLWAWDQGLFVFAAECWRRSRDEARRTGNRSGVMRSLNALGCIEYELGRFRAAQALWRRAEALMETEPGCDPRFRVKVMINLALAAYVTGRIEEALMYLRAARGWCGDLGPFWIIHVEQCACSIWMTLERWDEAEAAARRALELLAGQEADPRVAYLQTNLGQICLERGELASATAYLEAARELLERLGPDPNLGYTYGALGRLYYLLGDLDRAVAYGSEALRVLWPNVLATHKAEVALVSELFGWIALAVGDRQVALMDLQRASTYFAQSYRWRDWSRVNRLLDKLVREWGHGADRANGRAARIHPESMERLRYFTTLLDLLDSIESLYPDVRQKAELTGRYALRVGQALRLSSEDLDALSHAAKLHDIGLTSLDPEVVRQREPASPVARNRMRAHPLFGEKILSLFPLPDLCCDAVRHHHERYDGLGFPDGLAGEDIPLLARIIAVAATYVSCSLRHGHSAAMLELARRRGQHLDPRLVDVFTAMHDPVQAPVAASH